MTILSALDGHNFEVAQKKVSDLCHVATNVSNPDEITLETEEKFCEICHPRESWERIVFVVLWRHHLVRVLAHLGIRVAQSGTTWWVDGGNAVGALKLQGFDHVNSVIFSDFDMTGVRCSKSTWSVQIVVASVLEFTRVKNFRSETTNTYLGNVKLKKYWRARLSQGDMVTFKLWFSFRGSNRRLLQSFLMFLERKFWFRVFSWVKAECWARSPALSLHVVFLLAP